MHPVCDFNNCSYGETDKKIVKDDPTISQHVAVPGRSVFSARIAHSKF